MKLSSFLIIVLIIPLVLGSCKKKVQTESQQYVCGRSCFYLPASPVFKGFSADELKIVVLNKYVANSQFDTLELTDTLDLSNSIFASDTAYAASSSQWVKNGFFEIKVGNDYTIVIPAINKVFSITNVHEGPKSFTWLQDTPCSTSPGSLQPDFSYLLFELNNKYADIYYLTPHNYLVYLQR
ncbi:hypothetical protein F0919_03275 [Taibaiella lutea]|uniref:Lipoprotein n=1 Tax=Taibaiella lutea TaxID=2608001 RepID=A0A5M6CUM3_9BACT|nr:hypothetical protein [Taibaiella lutea]KAA5536705.1 hypothetical protein F0919_03275 [Taibaiella lutea]